MTSRAVLVIPAYKPTHAFTQTLRELCHNPGAENFLAIVVVNDGSGAEYTDIFRSICELPGVVVVDHAVNLGKGAALKTGINQALVRWPKACGVVTADADGQHAVADIIKVAGRLRADPEQLVLGTRGFRRETPLRSRIGNAITKLVFRGVTSVKVSDTQTGLRGWPRRLCLEALKVPLNGYDFELECLIRARPACGSQVREIPIETIYIDGNSSSHFNPLRDSMQIYFVFVRYCGSAMLAAVVDSIAFYLAYNATQNVALSQFAGRVTALTVAFTVARNLVFRSKTHVSSSLVRYLGLVAVMSLVSYSLMQFFHTRFHWPILGAKLAAEGLLFLGNFAIQRDFIFVRR